MKSFNEMISIINIDPILHSYQTVNGTLKYGHQT